MSTNIIRTFFSRGFSAIPETLHRPTFHRQTQRPNIPWLAIHDDEALYWWVAGILLARKRCVDGGMGGLSGRQRTIILRQRPFGAANLNRTRIRSWGFEQTRVSCIRERIA
jgi:hypothetical protein